MDFEPCHMFRIVFIYLPFKDYLKSPFSVIFYRDISLILMHFLYIFVIFFFLVIKIVQNL